MDFDKKIYKEYLGGNNEAFEILYSKYKAKIQYFIFNIIKDYEKAEDITQEVFIYIMKNKCKENISFKYYIYLIAKSRAFSYLNVENRRSEIVNQYLSNEKDENNDDLLKIIIKQENKKELLDAINKLEDKYRNAMYLVKIEELSYKQTAELLEETPQNIKNLIHRGKKELKKYLIKDSFFEIGKLPKVITINLGTGIMISTVAFANEIKNFIYEMKENIFGTYNDGISTAIENNYISDIDMDYIECNGIKIKIDSVFLDDYNLGVIYNVLVEEKNILKKTDVSKIELKNLLILDENNNILYADYENANEFRKYCEDNNLDKGVFECGYSNGECKRNILYKEKNANFIFTDLISSDGFPKSNKIYVSFDTIYFLNDQVYYFSKAKLYRLDDKKVGKNDYKMIKGNWKFEVDLNEIADKRNFINYNIKSVNDEYTDILKASLSMSNMKLELITSSDKINYEQLQNRDTLTMNLMNMIPFKDVYIETESGKRFSEIGSNGFQSIDENKIKYYTTFDYTYFDKEKNIKINLVTNKNELITIELYINNDEAQ